MGVIATGQESMAPGGAKDKLSPVSTEMKQLPFEHCLRKKTHHYFTRQNECLRGVQLTTLVNGITAGDQSASEEYQEGTNCSPHKLLLVYTQIPSQQRDGEEEVIFKTALIPQGGTV